MQLVYDNNERLSRNKTQVFDEEGKLRFWSIYDFSFKYRTRIYDDKDHEIAYVEKDVALKEDVVCFYDPLGKKTGLLKKEEGQYILEPDGLIYKGDPLKGEIEGFLRISEGKIEIEKDADVLKAIEVLFALIEIER
jgi:hypothetical protein